MVLHPRPTGRSPTVGTPPDADTVAGDSGAGGETADSTTYEAAQDYIDSLNADVEWIDYDPETNTATITSVADFATYAKTPSKSVAAFDDLDRGQAENNVFGNDESDSLHFDSVLAQLLADNADEYAGYGDWNAAYVDDYATDLQAVDALGSTVQQRVDMYNPMYYLLGSYDGYQTSTVAPYWRINTGIEQGDTANTVEVNLALALGSYDGVADVDFTTVWAQGHTQAERTGSATDNFIAWVDATVAN